MEVYTPIGRIIRSNPYAEMDNLQIVEYALRIEAETGFINPSLLREIESRGLYANFQKLRNPNMSHIIPISA